MGTLGRSRRAGLLQAAGGGLPCSAEAQHTLLDPIVQAGSYVVANEGRRDAWTRVSKADGTELRRWKVRMPCHV